MNRILTNRRIKRIVFKIRGIQTVPSCKTYTNTRFLFQMLKPQKQQEEEAVIWRPIERKCLSLLERTKSKKSLLQIHAILLRNAVDNNPNVLAKFIATCSSVALLTHASKVFDLRPHRDDTFLCNSMIKAHLDSRQFTRCFTLYRHLRRWTRFSPDNFTFTTLPKSCGLGMAVLEALEIHTHVVRTGFSLDLCVSTALVDMYAKLGEVGFARKMFDEMSERSLVSWTALIGGYIRSGDIGRARVVFEQMPEKDSVVYNAMIDGFVKVGDVGSARTLFDEMPERNVISWTSMIYGYCSNGDVSSARSLFDLMPEKNLFTWNSMINGYSQNKQPHEALKLFCQLQSSTCFEPDGVTFVSFLPAVADLGALELGDWIHKLIRRKGLDRATNVCTALVDMYAKCGDVVKARRVFDEMPEKESVSWNALINGYAVNGFANEALEMFSVMQQKGVKPNDVTMLGVLSACNHGGLVEEGKRWFKAMDSFSLVPKIEHYGCLVDLLGRAGLLDEAERLIKSMPYEANGIILSSFLFACWHAKDVTRAQRALGWAVNAEPWNDGNYVMLRNLYAGEKRWRDVAEIKGVMRKIGTKKEAGSSAIEVEGQISEFIAGGRMHPQWDAITLVLERLCMHMTHKEVGMIL